MGDPVILRAGNGFDLFRFVAYVAIGDAHIFGKVHLDVTKPATQAIVMRAICTKTKVLLRCDR